MAKTCTWAFIFRSDGAHPDVDYTEMMHCGNRFLIYGTNTVEEGCEVAKRIVEEENCILIELCGGYGPTERRKSLTLSVERYPWAMSPIRNLRSPSCPFCKTDFFREISYVREV